MPLCRGLRSQPLSPGDELLGDRGNSHSPPRGLSGFAHRVTGLKVGLRSGVQGSGSVGKSAVCPHGHKEGPGCRAEAAASPWPLWFPTWGPESFRAGNSRSLAGVRL